MHKILLAIVVSVSVIDGRTSDGRLFKRFASGKSANQQYIKTILEPNISLNKCAAACAATSKCLAFNYASYIDKNYKCELLALKGKTVTFIHHPYNSYYEEDCTPFLPPPNYCLNGGQPQFSSDVTCQLTNCSCLPRYRGNRCQQHCVFERMDGKDISGQSIDIGNYLEPVVDRCLDNCTAISNCLSVLYTVDKRCILKKESYYTMKTTDCGRTNSLYSIKCHEQTI